MTAESHEMAQQGTLLIPILGMDLGVQRSTMGMGLTLAVPTKREARLFGSYWRGWSHVSDDWLHHFDCVARLGVPIRWEAIGTPRDAGFVARRGAPPRELDVLAFLRLLKRGAIEAPRCILLGEEDVLLAGDAGSDPEYAVPWVIHEEKQYQFVRSDVAPARRLWRALVPVAQAYPPSFDQALRRFNRSYSYRPIDAAGKVAELIGGLEALYLYEIEELAYRLALRCAALLGHDGDSANTIFRQIKASYTVRSKVVHGEAVGERVRIAGQEFSLEELGDVLEEYLRRSLRVYLRLLPHESERMIKSRLLDELVLDRASSRLMRLGLARYRRFA